MARILYFGISRDLAGAEAEEVALTPSTSIDDVWSLLIERHPRLSAIRAASRLAVNMEYASSTTTVDDSSEIAIIPPVAGG